MTDIHSLQDTPLSDIVRAFRGAFADYAVAFSEAEILSILRRRGFAPSLSFAAFEQGQIVGFTYNGIGPADGLLSAYDTGTGVLPSHRGQGLAEQIFTASLPGLRRRGVRQYLLEVLTDNRAAQTVYQKLGFRVSRTFNCYRRSHPGAVSAASRYTIVPCAVSALVAAAGDYDFKSSWQNSPEALVRAGDDLTCLEARHQGQPVGHCVFDAATGDLSALVVVPAYRRQGVGRSLLQAVYALCHASAVKCLNVETGAQALSAFLEHNGFSLLCQQYEMRLDI